MNVTIGDDSRGAAGVGAGVAAAVVFGRRGIERRMQRRSRLGYFLLTVATRGVSVCGMARKAPVEEEKRGRGHPPAVTADGERLSKRLMIRAADKKIYIRATPDDETLWDRAAKLEGFHYGDKGAISPLGRKVLNAHVRKLGINPRASDAETELWARAAKLDGFVDEDGEGMISPLARKLLNAHAKRLGLS